MRELLARGEDHRDIGRRTGVPAGQAYLVGTGRPTDGGHSSDGTAPRPGEQAAPQHLVSPPHENPTSKQVVHEWIAARVAADGQQRRAGAAREERE
ncbi:hypothetical protein [Pseudonocardia oceani]|uniref:hypothetical protein n=1 Tax=Pseudonocardia oceani TaxID=2792013 RepID=UPI001CF64C15|nr:hypothetical protein [Pseudonocardia oceani]